MLIIGGGMANTFLAAQGKAWSASRCAKRDLDPERARHPRRKPRSLNREIVLPVDAVVAQKFAEHAPTRSSPSTRSARRYDPRHRPGQRQARHLGILARTKTLVWNGPFGAFEVKPFDIGTVAVAKAVAELTTAGKLVSFAGGGDTVAALNVAGVKARFTHVSTAGGAFLESLEGKTLPGVKVLLVSLDSPAATREYQ
jgi:phosphoglycerate kinase